MVNSVIHKICHDAWEKEVVAKKEKFAVGLIMNVSSNLIAKQPDQRANHQTEREEIDEEPVSGYW